MNIYNIKSTYALGIDAALSNFGVSIHAIDEDGNKGDVADLILLKTQREKRSYKNFDDLMRCRHLNTELRKIIEKYNPECIFAELPQPGGKNMQADSMVYAGCMMGILSSLNVPVYFFPTKEIKKQVLGYVTPDKSIMIDAMVKLYPNAPWKRYKRHGEMLLSQDNEHLADAIAAFEYGMQHTKKIEELMVLPK